MPTRPLAARWKVKEFIRLGPRARRALLSPRRHPFGVCANTLMQGGEANLDAVRPVNEVVRGASDLPVRRGSLETTESTARPSAATKIPHPTPLPI